MKIDKGGFLGNLLLTQFYCEKQINKPEKDIATVLRSYNPKFGNRRVFEFIIQKLGYTANDSFVGTDWAVDPLEDISFVTALFHQQLRHKQLILSECVPAENLRGRILVHELDMLIPDGVAEYETKGFLDYNDCPPIDTWFYIIHNTEFGRLLLAWIPESYTAVVNNGIAASLLDCIYWFEDKFPEEYTKFFTVDL